MRHLSVIQQPILALIFCILGTLGCSHYPATANDEMETMPLVETQDVLIREARAEADSLRSELAAIKISAAKQQAQLQTIHERAKSLQTREESMGSSMQQVQANLLTAESERDRLQQENSILQAQSASLPGIQQLQAEVHMIQDAVHQIAASMETLMTEVTLIKQEVSQSRRQARSRTASLSAFSMTTPSPAMTNAEPWVVKPGDTLWQIGLERNISVDSLMALNQLSSDLIVEGQTLQVPALMAQNTEQTATPHPTADPESISSE